MRIHWAAAAAAALLLPAGCARPAQEARLTQAQAGSIADHTVAEWESGDAARIKALYATEIVGYDAGTPAMSTTRAQWDKLQDAYAAGHYDRIAVSARRIQVLDDDTFVVTQEGTDVNSARPHEVWPFRCTHVYERQGPDRWLIVNENCSVPPQNRPPS